MKNCVLREFIETLKEQCRKPECQNGSSESEIPNATAKGHRQGLAECADRLSSLVELMRE